MQVERVSNPQTLSSEAASQKQHFVIRIIKQSVWESILSHFHPQFSSPATIIDFLIRPLIRLIQRPSPHNDKHQDMGTHHTPLVF